MKDIQTVTGALDPSLLGFTLMHEHLLISSWNNRITDPEWLPYEKALDFIAPVIAEHSRLFALQSGARCVAAARCIRAHWHKYHRHDRRLYG